MLHHKYLGKKLANKNSTQIKSQSNKVSKPFANPTVTKSIYLFKCIKCDIATDSYDNAVDHCQKHHNNMKSNLTITACKSCDLKFEENCFKKHEERHLKQAIDRNGIAVLNYNYNDLLTEKWFNIFDVLPTEEMTKVLQQSIYASRSVKMTLAVNGPAENTVYKCEICKNIVPYKDVYNHAMTRYNECAKSKMQYNCELCNISFGSAKVHADHERVHSSNKNTANLYRIVSFNDASDREFNKKLNAKSKITKTNEFNNTNAPQGNAKLAKVSSKQKNLQIMKIPTKNKYTYYECVKCSVCTSKHPRTTIHNCATENRITVCKECGYNFSTKGIYRHYKSHSEKNLTRDKIFIVPFNGKTIMAPVVSKKQHVNGKQKQAKAKQNAKEIKVQDKNKKPTKVNKIYKCSCGVHFPSVETITKHVTMCTSEYVMPCENCSKCGLPFPTNMLVNHSINHHSSSDSKNIVYNVPPLYRCEICTCLFLKKTSLINHARYCNGTDKGSNCPTCNLALHTSALSTHLLHHKKSITFVKDEKNKTKQVERDKVNVLYKCTRCDLNFLTYQIGLDHINNKHNQGAKTTTCKICGYRFIYKYLKEHGYLHHIYEQYRREDLEIIVLPDEDLNKNKDICKTTPNKDVEKLSYNAFPGTRSNTQESLATKNHTEQGVINENQNEEPEIVNLFKCDQCDVYYLTKSGIRIHCQGGHKLPKGGQKCWYCDRTFSIFFIERHILDHHIISQPTLKYRSYNYDDDKKTSVSDNVTAATEVLNDNEKDTSNNDSSSNESIVSQSNAENTTPDKNISIKSDVSPSAPTPKQSSYDFKLYKCGQCKVHFMHQTTCYKHVLHHEPISSVDYIECKICNLQFMITSISTHVKKHHAIDFGLDRVLVEEYNCVEGKPPKIDIYYAIDKVQSKLVSTTTGDSCESPIESIQDTKPDVTVPDQGVDDITNNSTNNSSALELSSTCNVDKDSMVTEEGSETEIKV
jgi:DNA-directed RNA polymerase subunit RPC12/RpoP